MAPTPLRVVFCCPTMGAWERTVQGEILAKLSVTRCAMPLTYSAFHQGPCATASHVELCRG